MAYDSAFGDILARFAAETDVGRRIKSLAALKELDPDARLRLVKAMGGALESATALDEEDVSMLLQGRALARGTRRESEAGRLLNVHDVPRESIGGRRGKKGRPRQHGIGSGASFQIRTRGGSHATGIHDVRALLHELGHRAEKDIAKENPSLHRILRRESQAVKEQAGLGGRRKAHGAYQLRPDEIKANALKKILAGKTPKGFPKFAPLAAETKTVKALQKILRGRSGLGLLVLLAGGLGTLGLKGGDGGMGGMGSDGRESD